MNKRRKTILKELGLMPLWHLRSNPEIQKTQTTQNRTEETVKNACEQDPEQNKNPAIGQMNWDQLTTTVANCQACPLRQSCTQTVLGTGDKTADWLFIGEAPGAREDALGEPFVGQAGQLLDNMLAAIDLKRGYDVYITNIVKCRPLNNRNPNENEVRQCAPYLARQIELIKPKLIIALGKVAAQNLLNSNDSIANLRGKIHDYAGTPLIVTYHPAYLLRALSDKSKAWKDLCIARELMESLV